tara:strand:- start:2752 stop:2991 length:240 start_codon:yes stop_codon:yes gene_type:complete
MKEKSDSKLFKVGDLVQYTPHFQDPVGPWKMFGDLGIVTYVDYSDERYPVIRVHWVTDGIEIEMADVCLTKVKNFKSST